MERFLAVISDDQTFIKQWLELRGNEVFKYLNLEVRSYSCATAVADVAKGRGSGSDLMNPVCCVGFVRRGFNFPEQLTGYLRSESSVVAVDCSTVKVSHEEMVRLTLQYLYQKRVRDILNVFHRRPSSGVYELESGTNLMGALEGTIRFGWGVLSDSFRSYLKEFLDIDDTDPGDVKVQM